MNPNPSNAKPRRASEFGSGIAPGVPLLPVPLELELDELELEDVELDDVELDELEPLLDVVVRIVPKDTLSIVNPAGSGATRLISRPAIREPLSVPTRNVSKPPVQVVAPVASVVQVPAAVFSTEPSSVPSAE